MNITDILFQYLGEVQYKELKTDAAYQEARSAQSAAESALLETLTPEQRRMFHDCREKSNYADALELRRMFSHCALLLTVKDC